MVISACKSGRLDHPTLNLLKEVKIDVPIVQINQFSDYEFNEDLYNLDKWVLADFLELGANDWTMENSLIWGRNSELFFKARTEEWGKFEQFVKDNPPAIIFKRELLKKDFKDNIYPIEFPCFHAKPPVNNKVEFDERSISVVNFWGHSHELRRVTHGNIFLNSAKRGYGVVDNFYHFQQAIKEYREIWSTIQVPHYARIDMKDLLAIQGHSKLSLSLYGAGTKCFRNSEASINSIMVMMDDNIAWSYDWIHGVNCIKIPFSSDHEEIRGMKNQWKVIDTIEAALSRNDLYEIYLNGVENCDRYRVPRYVSEYLEPIIKKHI